MELQLNLLSNYYYTTLGFEVELLDYLEHVNEQIVKDKVAPLYKKEGRPPIDPITYFRMHYLYFTRPEITSFRQLEKQLKDPKNQAWRNFIGAPGIKDVPSHASLSNFRTKVGTEIFFDILFNLVTQGLKLKGFLQTTLTGIDSRPIWANVNGYKKKRCVCQDPKKCACEKTFSDPDATFGVQRNKANQNKFFIGYRKHSIVCPTPKGPIVLFSIILPSDTADINVVLPLIEKMDKIDGLKVEYLVADLGYFDADVHRESLKKHDVALITGFKTNTIIPEHCSSNGKPECPEGHPLIFDGFDKSNYRALFRGDPEQCVACPLQGTCANQFDYSFDDHPFFNGPVPQGSLLQQHMLKFRKQVELAFALESNQLTSVMKHKKVPVRQSKRVEKFFIMRDMFQLIEGIIRHIRDTILPPNHVENIRRLQTAEFEQLLLQMAV